MIRAEIWARNTNFTLMYDRPPRCVEKGHIVLESAPVYRLAPRGAEYGARPAGGVILERKVTYPRGSCHPRCRTPTKVGRTATVNLAD